jgi:hypothetical protein
MNYEQGTEIWNIQNRDVGLFFSFIVCKGVIFWTRQVVFSITHSSYTIQGTKSVHEAEKLDYLGILEQFFHYCMLTGDTCLVGAKRGGICVLFN